MHALSAIGAEDTYYLGYLVYNEIKRQLDADPNNEELHAKHQMILEIRKKGKRNHDIFLTYDHMDVYVTTSMRERHEYYLVNGFIQTLFSRPSLTPLNLRFFDPTQAYCEDRLDKGLVEGLMLKRAKCTIYHAQETDTLGKDSELATTLAQGKPVIAYVPKLGDRDEFLTSAIALSDRLYPGLPRKSHLEKLLRLYDPDSAWNNSKIRGWLSGEKNCDEQEICEEWTSGKALDYMKVDTSDPRLLEYAALYDKLESKQEAVWESIVAAHSLSVPVMEEAPVV